MREYKDVKRIIAMLLCIAVIGTNITDNIAVLAEGEEIEYASEAPEEGGDSYSESGETPTEGGEGTEAGSGEPVFDENGNPVEGPVLDENGNPVEGPVLDENGNPIEGPYLDENGNPVGGPVYDAEGNPIEGPAVDENGNPIPVYDENGNLVPSGGESNSNNEPIVLEFKKDESGKLVLDENNKPIPLNKPEGVEIIYVYDENGEILLDADGNPIIDSSTNLHTGVQSDENNSDNKDKENKKDKNNVSISFEVYTDLDGNEIYDSKGNLVEVNDKIDYLTDSNGVLVKDEKGDPIVTRVEGHGDSDGDGICDDCGATLKSLADEIMDEVRRLREEALNAGGGGGGAAECDHEYECESNGDGTHTYTCKLCDKQYTEDCEFENKVCVKCGYSIEDEECEHEYKCEPNGDGTHTFKCELCGDEYTEQCEFEDGVCVVCGYVCQHEFENGVCVKCGYACDHSEEYLKYVHIDSEEEDEYLHRVICTRCGYEDEEPCEFDKRICKKCGFERPIKYISKKKVVVINGIEITVEGIMPDDSVIDIRTEARSTLESLIEADPKLRDEKLEVLEAYNISIYYDDGIEYQPVEHDQEDVKVSFRYTKGIDPEVKNDGFVVHVDSDYEIETYEDAYEGNDTFEVDTEHFSVFGIVLPATEPKMDLATGQSVAAIKQATNIGYTLVDTVGFNVYVTEARTYNYNVTIYTNLTDSSNPKSGTWSKTFSGSFKADDPGWVNPTTELDIDGALTAEDRNNIYVANGGYYSVIISFGRAVGLAYGHDSTSTYLINTSGKATRDAAHDGAILLHETTVAAPTDNVTIEQITATGADIITVGSDDRIYVQAGQAGVKLNAVLNPATAKRTITWSSTKSSSVAVATDGSLTIGNAGIAKVTASYVDGSGRTSSKDVTIYVVDVRIDDDSTKSLSKGYIYEDDFSGNEIKPPVTVTAESQYSADLVNVTYENNVNAGEAAKIKVAFTPVSGYTYNYNYTFKINALEISKVDFSEAEFEIDEDKVIVKNSPIDTKYYTATVSTGFPKGQLTKIEYSYTITGNGNYKGTQYVLRDVSASDMNFADVFEARFNSRGLDSRDIYFDGLEHKLTETKSGGVSTGWEGVDFYFKGTNIKATFITGETATAIYNNNVNAGQASVEFRMNSASSYAGLSNRLTYTIQPESLPSVKFEWKNQSFAHTDKEIKPKQGVDFDIYIDNGETALNYTLKYDEDVPANCDYTVSYQNNTDVGTAFIIITGKDGGNFQGQIRKEFYIVQNFINDAEVRFTVGNHQYKAKNNQSTDYVADYTNPVEQISNIGVYLNNGKVKTSDGYTVSFEDANGGALTKAVGTKYIVITGTNSYAGESIKVSYTVAPKDISELKVVEKASLQKVYSAREQALEDADFEIKWGNDTLELGKDYTAEISGDKVNAGEKTYVLNGKGNYKGQVTGTFKIEPADISDTSIATVGWTNGKAPVRTYTGEAQTVDPTDISVLLKKSNVNAASANYKLSYLDNIAAGKAKVTVEGQNNLKGSKVLEFDISPDATGLTIKLDGHDVTPIAGVTGEYTCADYEIVYSGKHIDELPNFDNLIEITSTSSGKTLVSGRDYGVATYNDLNAKDYKVATTGERDESPYFEITGYDNYDTYKARVYINIKKAKIASATIADTNKVPTEGADFEYKRNSNVAIEDRLILSVTYQGKTLVKDTDYTVTWPSGKDDAGTDKEITINAKGTNFEGTTTCTYTIGKSIKDATITLSYPNGYKNGQTIPFENGEYQVDWVNGDMEYEVKIGDTKLTEGATQDYVIEEYIGDTLITNRADASNYHSEDGTKKIKVKFIGSGDYYGEKEIIVHIRPVDLSTIEGAAVVFDPTCHAGEAQFAKDLTNDIKIWKFYAGGDRLSINPTVVYNYGTRTVAEGTVDVKHNLVKDTDFTLDTPDIGGAITKTRDEFYAVKLTGKGDFKGTKTFYYGVEPGFFAVEFNTKLNPVTKPVTKVGTAKPIGDTSNYYHEYDINTANIYYTGSEVSLNIASDDADVATADLAIYNGKGQLLVEGRDYTVSKVDGYDNKSLSEVDADGNPKASAYTGAIKITGKNNYAGESVVKFYIVAKDISDDNKLSATITPFTFNGSPVTPSMINSGNISVYYDGIKQKFGTDYEVVASSEYADNKMMGTNIYPGSDDEGTEGDSGYVPGNYITISGKGAFTGLKRVYFDIQLDITDAATEVVKSNGETITGGNSASKAKVTVSQAYTSGDMDSVVPTIEYKKGLEWIELPVAQNGTTPIKNYSVSRVSGAATLGTDDIRVTGKKYAKGSVVIQNIAFSTLLSNSGLSIEKDRWEFTSDAVRPAVSGLQGDPGKDYVITYSDMSGHTDDDALKVVGEKKITITPVQGSSYYRYKDDTGAVDKWVQTYTVFYNLYSKTTVVYTLDETNKVITEAEYKEGGYTLRLGTNLHVKCGIKDGMAVTDPANGTDISDICKVDGNSFVTLSAVGEKQMTISSTNENVSGSKLYGFKLTGINLLDKDRIEITVDQGPFVFTGSAIEPTVTVHDKKLNKDLVRGEHFRIKYIDNVNAGTAQVWIIGLKEYKTEDYVNSGKTFTIGKRDLKITDNSDGINVTVENCVYNGKEQYPEVTVVLKTPGYPDYELHNGTDFVVQEKDYTNNVTSTEYQRLKGSSVRPKVKINIGDGKNFKAATNSDDQIKEFVIEQLNVNNADIKITENEAEYLGKDIVIADGVEGLKLMLGDYELKQNKAGVVDADYEVAIYKGATTVSAIKEVGEYTVVITGINNCKDVNGDIKYKVTARSLPKNCTNKWDSSQKKFVSGGDIVIKVNDVPTFKDGETVIPEIYEFYDKGVTTDESYVDENGNTHASGKPYQLVKDKDYTIKAYNNTSSGTGEYSTRPTDVDEYGNANPKQNSPYVEITGIGNYDGTIKVVFDIGKSIKTLQENYVKKMDGDTSIEEWVEVSFTARQSYYDDNPSDFLSTFEFGCTGKSRTYGSLTGCQYTYNGETQKPKAQVLYCTYDANKNVVKTPLTETKGDIEVSVTDVDDNEDTSIEAGMKYLTIKGSNSYCGILKQPYRICKKAVRDTVVNKDENHPGFTTYDAGKRSFVTREGGYSFKVEGLSIMTANVANKLKDETGVDYSAYIGYLYSEYAGQPIEPKIEVTDNKLGFGKTTAGAIAEKDLDVSYVNSDVAYVPKSDAQDNMSSIWVRFKSDRDDDGNDTRNYYADPSVAYKINYIIVVHNITNSFVVDFENGTDKQEYAWTGSPIEPKLIVSNGTDELEKGVDYDVEYKDNVAPGVATVEVTGMGNYKGKKALNFYIIGDLSKTAIYYINEDGEKIKGETTQQYTGKEVEPKYLLVLENAAGPGQHYELKYWNEDENDKDYKKDDLRSDNRFTESGEVTYSGRASKYWTGTKTIPFVIRFDESLVKIKDEKDKYQYTGSEIIPKYELTLETAKIQDVLFYRGEEFVGTFEDDKFEYAPDVKEEDRLLTDVTEDGIKIRAIVEYKVGSGTTVYQIPTEFVIEKRSMGSCTIVCATNNRYTGYQVQPPCYVYFRDYDNNMVVLDESEYSLEYGENIIDAGYVKAKPNSGNFTGTKIKAILIKPGKVSNIKLSSPVSTAIKVDFTKDIYSAGEEISVYKMKSDGTVPGTPVVKKTLTGKTTTYTFTGLQSSSKYMVSIKSFVKLPNGSTTTTYYSDASTANITTGMSETGVQISSPTAGKVRLTWSNSGDIEIYKIYRCPGDVDYTNLSNYSKIASYPASVGSYTNSGLTSGNTYYYYVVGYTYMDGQLVAGEPSDPVFIEVK